jgi:hypothetical protein
METKFTPGPWRFSKINPVRGYGIFADVEVDIDGDGYKEKRSICIGEAESIYDRHSKCDLPNARLIAAAPAMYDALDALLKSYRVLDDDGPEEWSKEWQDCCAALKKARGEL